MSYLDRLVAEHDQDIDDIYVELRQLQRDKADRYSSDARTYLYGYSTTLNPYPMYRKPRRDAWYDNYIKIKELEWADKEQKLNRLKNQALRAEYV